MSPATASYVFTSSSRVSEQARAAVLAAAEELQYSPLRRHVAKARATFSSVGFVILDTVPFASDPVFSHVFHEAERACTPLGLSLMAAAIPVGASTPADLPLMLQRRQVDGVLAVGYYPRAFFDLLAQLDLPCVVVDYYYDGIPVDCVTGQDRYGGYLATRCLLELGHRSPPPAIIIGPQDEVTRFYKEGRLRGYRQALAEFGIPSDDAYIRCDSGSESIAQLLALPRPPTAVFCWHDRTALQVVNALHERGIEVPKECSVVGFDDSDLASQAFPPLSTIHVDRTMMVRTALDLLLQRVKQRDATVRHVHVGVRLVNRLSLRRR